MKLRQSADAILVGVNTVLADNPRLTRRQAQGSAAKVPGAKLRRIILDSRARTPLDSHVVTDGLAALTTVVVTKVAPKKRMMSLSRRVQLWLAPERQGKIDLRWLLQKLGAENITSLLVEGGGEVNASFLLQGLAHRVTFFYAPKIIGGRDAIKAVGGKGILTWNEAIRLREVEWRRLGPDLLLSARVDQI